jgi:peptidoglycan/xylan/chitin deacetylase (PgdA/CDA1 family)
MGSPAHFFSYPAGSDSLRTGISFLASKYASILAMKQFSRRLAMKILLATISFAVFVIFLKIGSNYQTKNTGTVIENNSVVPVSQNSTIMSETKISSPSPIPILMFHYIRDYNDPSDEIGTNLSVSPNVFSSEISRYKYEGYNTISFDEYLSGKSNAKSIILTFDDGYDDAYQAANILKTNGLIGVFYIITGKIGTAGYLSQNQIKEMSDDGMVIGSHSISHPDLSKTNESKIRLELKDSKQTLEQITGKPVNDFCYPSGKYSSTVSDIAKELGYKTAVTTVNATSGNFTSFFELPRLRVSSSDTPESLIKRSSKLYE